MSQTEENLIRVEIATGVDAKDISSIPKLKDKSELEVE